MTTTIKVIMLANDKESSRIMYNGLKRMIPIDHVIIESSASRSTLIKNKIKKFGFINAIGQFSFIVFNSLQRRFSRLRIQSIKQQENLDTAVIPEKIVERVESVNDHKTAILLNQYQADIIIVNGTRIIKKGILESTNALFINTHMGITPKYRGVHGAYWAMASGDQENCGVTIHLVDQGIDTGNILCQSTVKTTHKDNFNTYPYLQMAKAIPLMKGLITYYGKHRKVLPLVSNNLSSKIWTHPTLFEYLSNWALKKVR